MAVFTTLSAAVGTFFAGLTMKAVGVFALKMVASLGLSALAQKLSGKKKGQEAQPFGVKGQLGQGSDTPQAFIIGRYATAGTLTYANTYAKANKWMTWAITLSDMPVTELSGIWVNGSGQTMTDMGDGWSKLSYYEEALQVRFYDGTQTVADDWLMELSTPERPWDSSAIGHGKAYVVVRAYLDENKFSSGFPSFLFEVRGIPLYNPARDTTVGGNGSHRWGNPATWENTENPAVQLYNILRGIRYKGEWFYGLQDIDEPQLPVEHWIWQIGICDQTVTGANGPEPRFRAAAEIPVGAEIHTAIEALLDATNGRLSDAGGVYKLFVGTPGIVPEITFYDSDIISTDGQTFTPFLGLSETVNGVSGHYPSPDHGWQTETAPPLYRPDYEAEDGGRRLLVDISLDFVPFAEQAQRVMKAALNEARRARRHTFTMPPEFWPVETGDVLAWTSERNGYSEKQFRIDGIIDLGNADVMLDLTEVDPSDYAWDTAVDFTPPAIGETEQQPIEAEAIEDFAVFPASLKDADGTGRRPAILAVWDGAVEDVAAIKFELRVKATGEAIDPVHFDTVSDGQIYISTGILPDTEYEVRAKFVPASPRPTDWTAWKSVTTPDVKLGLVDIDQAVRDEIQDAKDKADQVRQDHDALVGDFVGNLGDEFTAIHDEIDGLEFPDMGDFEADLTALTARVGDTESNLADNYYTGADTDTAIALAETALNTSIGNVAADLVNNYYTKSDADGATAVQVTALKSQMEGPGGSVKAAQDAAQAASNLAGSKGKVIVQNSAPTGANRAAENLWINTTGGKNTPNRWNASTSAWEPVTDKAATDAAAAAQTALGKATATEANLTQNYLTKVLTNQAIAAAEQRMNVSYGPLSGEIADIKGLKVNKLTGTALATLLTQLETNAGGTSAKISTMGTALSDLEGNAEASYVFRATAGAGESMLELVAADDVVNGPSSSLRLTADHILLDGSVSARFMYIDGRLQLDGKTAGFLMGKNSAYGGGDGIYMGRTDEAGGSGFGLAITKTAAGGVKQQFEATYQNGLRLTNANFYRNLVVSPPPVEILSNRTITLSAATTDVYLDAMAGGGGGGGPAGSNGLPGGNTVIKLMAGTTTKKTWVIGGGAGGIGGGSDSNRGDWGEGTIWGNGGSDMGGSAGGYGSGGGGKFSAGPWEMKGGGGGKRGSFESLYADVRGYAGVKKIVITVGNAGSGSPDGYGGTGYGRPGRVQLVTQEYDALPADVVPINPTAVGRMRANANFPNLGAGVYTMSVNQGAHLSMGEFWTGGGWPIAISMGSSVTFVSELTPLRNSNQNNTHDVTYIFRKMGP